jgi:hypothetical protein
MAKQEVQNPAREFTLEGDLYQVQRRPMHPHIVVNDDYRGIRVLDPWSGTDVLRVGFTEEYRASGVISGWCFRSDGASVLVLNEAPRTACWLPLDPDGCSFNVACPPLRRVADLRYLWEGDSFWITGGKSHDFYEQRWERGLPNFVASGGLKARIDHPNWRRALECLPLDGCNVERVESDNSQMLYHYFAASPERVGMVAWRSGVTWSTPAPDEVQRLAFHGDRMFVMRDYEVHALNRQGQVEAVYPASKNFRYCGLDTLPAQDAHPAALVLISSAQHDSHLNQCLVYQLE